MLLWVEFIIFQCSGLCRVHEAIVSPLETLCLLMAAIALVWFKFITILFLNQMETDHFLEEMTLSRLLPEITGKYDIFKVLPDENDVGCLCTLLNRSVLGHVTCSYQLTTGHLVTIWSYNRSSQDYLWPGFKILKHTHTRSDDCNLGTRQLAIFIGICSVLQSSDSLMVVGRTLPPLLVSAVTLAAKFWEELKKCTNGARSQS